jgi:hypothetical protein
MTAHCLCTPKTHTIIHDRSLSFDIFFSEVSMVFTTLVLRYKFLFICVLLFSVTSNSATFLWLFQVKIWISIDISRGIFTFYVQWVEVSGYCSFCWYWLNYWPSQFKLSLFCWYWWNYWPSLFKLSLVSLILVELLTITV